MFKNCQKKILMQSRVKHSEDSSVAGESSASQWNESKCFVFFQCCLREHLNWEKEQGKELSTDEHVKVYAFIYYYSCGVCHHVIG